MLLGQTTQPANLLVDFIVPLVPWILIFGFLWFFVLRTQRRQSKTVLEQQARTREHQAAVEAKLDRLIELAERRNGSG